MEVGAHRARLAEGMKTRLASSFYSSAARSSPSVLTHARAFPVSDPTSGQRTCKGWPTPAVGAKISRSSHLSSDGPGKGVGPATAITYQHDKHDIRGGAKVRGREQQLQ